MTRRVSWLLLHIAWTSAALSGCSLFAPRNASSRQGAAIAPPAVRGTQETAKIRQQKPEAEEGADRLSPSEKTSKIEVAPRPELAGPVPAEKQGEIRTAAAGPPAEPGSSRSPQTEKAAPPLVEALRCMLEDRHQEALRHLQAYDQETQAFFLRLLPPLALFAKKGLEQLTPQEVAVLNEQLQGVLLALRPRTELIIEQLCFCEWIKAYGNYKALSPNHAFLAAAPERLGDKVQLYFELRNFASAACAGGFETRLSSSVEIHDAQGNLRKRYTSDEQPLKRLTRLHDYCNQYFFLMPELEPGSYQLTLQIVDETLPEARRVARKTIEFRVTAAPGALE
jgi:hypothetical protein